ncbi:hypothetical protein V6N12_014763 [Hibiscus sabdariffa]|uniref:Uncharacterized protein n=1 Tax=Hibiscus sabdariffa TaxID=183260 RepID=A0ABR2DL62_9ROSI
MVNQRGRKKLELVLFSTYHLIGQRAIDFRLRKHAPKTRCTRQDSILMDVLGESKSSLSPAKHSNAGLGTKTTESLSMVKTDEKLCSSKEMPLTMLPHPVIGSSSGEPSPELRRSWTFFRFGYQTPSSSIVCLAQPVRSALFRESVITGSSTVAERFRYLLDRSELLFQISSRLFLSWHWRSDTHL